MKGWTRERKTQLLGFSFRSASACSHEIWFNPSTGLYTTIPNHPGELPEGTLRAILRQAGVTLDEFLAR
ncbi:MAG: type II toxin-antitoxin system HicA family toxin [Desulfurellaceae bacterium]|nr:type II toxin-antitoxin system HicA family toxin [Desulfurellaceae bacterium]